jgi:hypothetical protein
MATATCVSKGPTRKWSIRWYLVMPFLALLFQLVPPVLLYAISTAFYVEPRRLPESWERPVSLLTLAFCAGIGLALGSVATHGLLSRARPWLAWLLIAACCVPALIGGAVYLHGLLVFLAIV